MSSIREFEDVLHRENDPDKVGEPKKVAVTTTTTAPKHQVTEEERPVQRKTQEVEGPVRPEVTSVEKETAPRLRHTEQHQASQQRATSGGPNVKGSAPSAATSANERRQSAESQSTGNKEKTKWIKELGASAKKTAENVFRKGRSWGLSKWLLGLLALLTSLFILSLATASFSKAFFPYPSHASCQMNVTLFRDQLPPGASACESAKSALVHQMKKWETKENCKNGGMKCLYKVTHVGDDELTGTHKTSDWFGFKDELAFKFYETPRGDCFVSAYSRSTVPFAYIDFSVNYCNIHNLLVGYGFDKFEEITSDAVCTQYSTHDCEKY